MKLIVTGVINAIVSIGLIVIATFVKDPPLQEALKAIAAILQPLFLTIIAYLFRNEVEAIRLQFRSGQSGKATRLP